MRAKAIGGGGERTWALVFATGDEVVSSLTEFARREQLGAARFTAIGAFRDATLGYFDWSSKQYEKIPLREQVEVLSLVGDVALEGDAPKIHAHVVVGKRDGSAHGGHLLEARVRPTLEVMLIESPAHLRRRFDPESGLALIEIDPAKAARR
ncbi:MAG TPA: PPC domain-containing DNA-binding protein [Casimicrobiaceae bacterium]|nr:PPC domain-containing DNA-binding protein [Casimicrobiaceae bacterium]